MSNAELRLAIHAPTRHSLERARRYLNKVMQARPGIIARIVLNGDAVEAALDGPDDHADRLTFICPTTLKRIGRTAPAPMTVMPEPAIISLGLLQLEGWQYIRA